MSFEKEGKEQETKINNIRITVSATNAPAVDKACNEIVQRARRLNNKPDA